MRRVEWKKGLLMTVGLVSVGLGTVGVFLPLLPTTPFLLLAAACFIRSSERLYAWLMHHRWFGPYIRNYREHRAITLRAKILTLALLWSMIAYSAVFVVRAWGIRALLGVIALGVTVHVMQLKTLTRDMLRQQAFPGTGRPES